MKKVHLKMKFIWQKLLYLTSDGHSGATSAAAFFRHQRQAAAPLFFQS